MFEIGFVILFIVGLLIKCMYFQFATMVNMKPFWSAENLNMIISSLGVLLIITSLILIIFNRKRCLALFITSALFTVLFMADTNYFRYYYNAISIPVLYQFSVKVIGSVNQSVMSLFKPADILYIIDLPFMIWGLIVLRKNKVNVLPFTKKAIAAALTLVVGFTCFISAYAKTDTEFFPYDNNYVIRSLGIMYFHAYDIKSFLDKNVFNDEFVPDDWEKLNAYYSNKNNEKNNKDQISQFKGIAKGKNLIMVQVEALQQFVINKTINGVEITPNINKLIKESLYFDNIYYQVSGGNTSDAEFLSNTSLYPLTQGSVYHIYPENLYYTLPKYLEESGYDTYVMHAFEPNFWNREVMYQAIGYNHYYNKEDFVLDDFAGWDGKVALSDESFFRQSLEKIDTTKPFYSFFITLSSHHPFTYFEENSDFDVGEFQGTFVGNYLRAAHYADYAIGKFIDDLKEKGLYDDSLIVLYGDHSAVPKVDMESLLDFLDMEYSDLEWTKLQKVPLVIHYPGLMNGETISTAGGQIDILPTIANLMDFDTPYAFGHDLINSKKGYAILKNGSIVTDEFIYVNDTHQIFDKDGNELDFEDYKDEITGYLDELALSNMIIEKDAFRQFTIDSIVNSTINSAN